MSPPPGLAQAGPPARSRGSEAEAVLVIALAFGISVFLVTEILGAARMLGRWTIVGAWGLIGGACLLRYGSSIGRRRVKVAPVARSALDRLMLSWVLVVCSATLVVAASVVPRTWDSMTYHLPRVSHWVQNGSVAFHPTNIVRQLYQPPWAEYTVLHLRLLVGSDRFANLVQWGAMVACLVAVCALARGLGAGARGQILGVLFCATIPMGVLQATTTQNDYAVAFWLACVAWWLGMAGGAVRKASLGGSALGLALVTKGTAAVYAGPFVALYAARALRRAPPSGARCVAIVLVCSATIAAPHAYRNYVVFGSPLGPDRAGPHGYMNAAMSPAVFASNAGRNLAVHLGTPWRSANEGIDRAVRGLHHWLGIDPDDARTTWPGTRFGVRSPVPHEDLAGNGIHLVVMIWCLALLAWRAHTTRASEGRTAMLYGLCVVGGFALFVVVLRWQPWHSRLHLPLFVLGAPFVGLVLERHRVAVQAILAIVLAATSVPYVIGLGADPVMGRAMLVATPRSDQREAHVRALRPEYLGAARALAEQRCRHVGLILGEDAPEYMLWDLLAGAGVGLRLEHIHVSNPSRGLVGSRPIEPCAIVIDSAASAVARELDERRYLTAWSSGTLRIVMATEATRKHIGP